VVGRWKEKKKKDDILSIVDEERRRTRRKRRRGKKRRKKRRRKERKAFGVFSTFLCLLPLFVQMLFFLNWLILMFICLTIFLFHISHTHARAHIYSDAHAHPSISHAFLSSLYFPSHFCN